LGRDISVDISTRDGLDDPGIESWWEARFFTRVWPALGPTLLPVQLETGIFSGGKVAREWRWQSTTI